MFSLVLLFAELARLAISLVSWMLAATPGNADLGTAFKNLALLFAGFAVPILSFILVVNGYHYMTAGDDIQAKTNAKRGMGAALGGVVLVLAAVALATLIGNAIQNISQ